MAQRYKDRTCVLFGAVNELFQHPPTSTNPADWPTSWQADLYKNHMRKWAPNTMIMGLSEPVNIEDNWGPYMRDVLGPAAGINWTGGKDCFSFHAYSGSASNITATRSAVPTMLSEFSFSAEGWTQLNLGGYSMPAEWCERNGMSWIVWQDRKPADQLSAVMNYLIPDAIAKKYAWWANTSAQSPKAPAIAQLETANQWAAFHHEHLSGKGYPFHLKSKDLPLGSRIMAVADVFTALTEDRPYRKGMGPQKTMAILNEDAANSQLDHDMVSLLRRHYDQIDGMRATAQRAASEEYVQYRAESAQS
jgi:hypothetical protein